MENNFKSGKLFLEITQQEYQNELDRTKVIDSKIAVALPIIATYFFLVVQFSSVKELISIPITSQTLLGAIIEVCNPISYMAALALACFSLFFLFRVISAHSYKAVEPRQFNTASQISMDELEFAAAFATVYINAVEENRSQNDKRVQDYMKGWRFAIISLVCFVIHVLFVGKTG